MLDAFRSRFTLTISGVLASLSLMLLAGCAGITVKDSLPQSSPKGYADFANETESSQTVYSMKGGKKVKEGTLGYKGAVLRIARTPGTYDFLLEYQNDAGKNLSHLVTVKVERDMVTFITADARILEREENIYDRMPTVTIRYSPVVTVADNPAPLTFQASTARDTLRALLNDRDWRARLYAVTAVGKMQDLRDDDVISAVVRMASDDPQTLVRRKASAVLKERGKDPSENILFLENFEANNKRRWISAAGQYDSFYNDEFVLQAADKCEIEMLTTPLDLPRSFDVELACGWRSGADNEAYGFLLGSDKDNFDQFSISGDGRATVRSTRNTEPAPDLIGWTPLDAVVKRGTNRLKVEVRGNVWKFSVNGAAVGTVENKLEVPPYALGLAVCQKQTVAFDQLKITFVPEK